MVSIMPSEEIVVSVRAKPRQLGKQPPRYRFFLDPYPDVRFTTSPRSSGSSSSAGGNVGEASGANGRAGDVRWEGLTYCSSSSPTP